MNSIIKKQLTNRVLSERLTDTVASSNSIMRPLCLEARTSGLLTKTALVMCLLCFWALCETALAEGVVKEQVNLELKDIDNNQVIARPVSLKTDIGMKINGPIVRATVKQSFENPSQHWVEGVYTFPLPEGAAVDQLKMYVGDRVIEGQVKEKRVAKKLYTKAKKEGKRAALLEKPKGHFFTTRVANIAPGAQVKIVFSYQNVLDFKDHGYSLRVPLVATPQYDPNVSRGMPALMAQENQIYYQKEGEPNINPVGFSLDIGAGMPVERLWSDSHTLNIDKHSDTVFKVSAVGSAAESNRDFVLNWRYAKQSHAQVSLFTEQVKDEYYNMIMLMPPGPGTPIEPEARELVFVLDVSGSMQGASIRQAKEAIRSALLSLNAKDRFNILFFNDSAWSVFTTSRQATSRNLLKARLALDSQEAEKGTEMSSALKLAMKKRDSGLFRQVIFITDGAVSNEDALLTVIKKMLLDTRLFTVGIGSAPNSYFMRRAAEMGRGTYTYINDLSLVQQKMQRLFEKINHPALTDIDIALDVPLSDLMPNPTQDLYMNEAGYLLFKTKQLPSELHIEALHGESPAYLQQRIGQTNAVEGIAVEWARQKIEHLTERALNTSSEGRDFLKSQATELAIEHHQVSKYTSLVAVDVTPVRLGADLLTQKVKSNLPKGWQTRKPDSQIYHLAQTATDAPWMSITGFIWLCVALALWLITKLRTARMELSVDQCSSRHVV